MKFSIYITFYKEGQCKFFCDHFEDSVPASFTPQSYLYSRNRGEELKDTNYTYNHETMSLQNGDRYV